MKFKREYLRDLLWNGTRAVIELDEIVDTTRWSVVHRLIFKHGDKLYETHYNRPATEMQEEQPWEYEGDEIECNEVEQFERTVIDYRAVEAIASHDGGAAGERG